MKKRLGILLLGLACAMLICGCPGHRGWSERKCYDVACEAALADPAFPEGGEIGDFNTAELYVGKSAARVDLRITYPGDTGAQLTGSYVLQIDRVGTDWRVKELEFRPAGHLYWTNYVAIATMPVPVADEATEATAQEPTE